MIWISRKRERGRRREREKKNPSARGFSLFFLLSFVSPLLLSLPHLQKPSKIPSKQKPKKNGKKNSVDGQDIVYKDIIEPLESVSVSVTSTDKSSIDEFGSPEEVAQTLASSVLTPASQEVKVLSVKRSVVDGRAYVDFEFAAKAPSYLRHALARVTVANGKFYTLTTGANELRRWGKVKDTLGKVVASFKVADRFDAV